MTSNGVIRHTLLYSGGSLPGELSAFLPPAFHLTPTLCGQGTPTTPVPRGYIKIVA